MISLEDYKDCLGYERFNEAFAVDPIFFDKGTMYLTKERYLTIKEILPKIYDFDIIPYLTGEEAAFIYKYEAPAEVFGDFETLGEFEITKEMSHLGNDILYYKRFIDYRLDDLKKVNGIKLIKAGDKDIPVEIIKGNEKLRSWYGVINTKAGYELFLDGFILTF